MSVNKIWKSIRRLRARGSYADLEGPDDYAARLSMFTERMSERFSRWKTAVSTRSGAAKWAKSRLVRNKEAASLPSASVDLPVVRRTGLKSSRIA